MAINGNIKPVVKSNPNGTGGTKPGVKVYSVSKPTFTKPAKPHNILKNSVSDSDINRVKKATKTQMEPKSSSSFGKFLGQ